MTRSLTTDQALATHHGVELPPEDGRRRGSEPWDARGARRASSGEGTAGATRDEARGSEAPGVSTQEPAAIRPTAGERGADGRERSAPRERSNARPSSIYDWTAALTAPVVQLEAFDSAITDLHLGIAEANHQIFGDPLPTRGIGAWVQLRGGDERAPEEAVLATAAAGVGRGGGGSLPFQSRIQASFGRHDISNVRAHTGPEARAAAAALGAHAYATGADVVLGSGGEDLHTVAHEAAHVIQQRAGVSLKGRVGQAGDVYERHADAVADAVVQGRSAEALLDRMAGAGSTSAVAALQLDTGSAEVERELDEPVPDEHEAAATETDETSGGGAGDGLPDLCDLSYEEQVAALTPPGRWATERPLHEVWNAAWALGGDVFGAVTDRMSPTEVVTAAEKGAPAGLFYLLDRLWPPGTGVELTFALSGDGSLQGTDVGIPFDVEGEVGLEIDLSLMRDGTKIVFGVRTKGSTGSAGSGSIKVISGGLGVATEVVTSCKVAVDLKHVTWPSGAWQKLVSGDLRDAFNELCNAGASIKENTQVTIEVAPGGSVSIPLGGGLADAVLVTLEGGARLGLSAEWSNATEHEKGKLSLSGDVGAFGDLGLEALGRFGADLVGIKRLVRHLLGLNLEETAGGGSAAVAVGMGLEVEIAPGSEKVESVKLKLIAKGELGLRLLRQEAKGKGKVEVVLAPADIDAFIEATKDGVSAGDGVKALVFSSLDGTLAVELSGADIFGIFSSHIRSVGGLAIEEITTLSGAVSLKLSIPREIVETALDKRQELIKECVTLMLSGDVAGALRVFLGGQMDWLADLVSCAKKLKITVKAGRERRVGGGTPLSEVISGGGAEGKAALKAVYEQSFDVEEYAPAIAAFLRTVVA